MLPRRLILFGVIGAVASARAMSACSTDEPAPRSAVSTSVDGSATVADSICPLVAPDAGDVCLLPEGTVCPFGSCGTPIAQCTGGTWKFGDNPAGPPCPSLLPTSEAACPPCWPATQTCAYGSDDCSKPTASANRTIASCPDGTWTLTFYPCADASTDVQGDASADRE